MKKTNTTLKLALACILIMPLSSCIPLMIGAGAAAVGGKMATQNKTIGESISDSTIWTKIRASFVKNHVDGLLGSINIEVNEGQVLLTGSVNNKEDIITVLKIVWQQDGVKDVINELKILPKNERPGVMVYTKDSWITSQLKAKMLFASNIKSMNYSIETIDSVVYLFGTANTEEEAEEAKDIASQVSGVKEVVSYIRIKKNIDTKIAETKGKVILRKSGTDEDVAEEEDVDYDNF